MDEVPPPTLVHTVPSPESEPSRIRLRGSRQKTPYTTGTEVVLGTIVFHSLEETGPGTHLRRVQEPGRTPHTTHEDVEQTLTSLALVLEGVELIPNR